MEQSQFFINPLREQHCFFSEVPFSHKNLLRRKATRFERGFPSIVDLHDQYPFFIFQKKKRTLLGRSENRLHPKNFQFSENKFFKKSLILKGLCAFEGFDGPDVGDGKKSVHESPRMIDWNLMLCFAAILTFEFNYFNACILSSEAIMILD